MTSPLDVFRRKTIDVRIMTARQWAAQPPHIRTRTFFSSRIGNAPLLQYMRNLIDDYLAGTRILIPLPDGSHSSALKVQNKAHFISLVRSFMNNHGIEYNPHLNHPANIGSRIRLSHIFDTSINAAYGQAKWENGMTPQQLNLFPAWRLIRHPGAKHPRPEHSLNEGIVMLKTDYAFWAHEMNGRHLRGFEVPWPPFGFNSYMDIEPVSRTECDRLGIYVPQRQIVNAAQFGAIVDESTSPSDLTTKTTIPPELILQAKKDLKKSLGADAVDDDGQITISRSEFNKRIEQQLNKKQP